MSNDAPSHRRASAPQGQPRLSLVVLQWDNLALTRACVDSLRAHTDVPHELIIVDNGSADDAVAYARDAADVVVCNGENLGFGAGMNAGLDVARGEWIAFINNDTQFPAGWASRLLATAAVHHTGMIVPAVTQAGNPRTVRTEPADVVEVLPPFIALPAGAVVVMPTDLCRALGAYGADEYPIASGEDVDLAFKVWSNDLDIVYDQFVVVDHVGHATADEKLPDRAGLWAANRERLFRKWIDTTSTVPRLPDVTEVRHLRNRQIASEATALRKAATDARQQLQTTRDAYHAQHNELQQCRQDLQAARQDLATRPGAPTVRLTRRIGQRLPDPLTRALLPGVRRVRSWRRWTIRWWSQRQRE